MKKRTDKKSSTDTRSKKQPPAISKAADQDVVGLLTVLVQKLTSFESKLDTVLSRIPTQAAPAPKPQPLPLATPPSPQAKPPRENRPMFQAVCADCGKDCEVPFRPQENRPVYCKECFAQRKNKGIFRPQEPVKPTEARPRNVVSPPEPATAKPAKLPPKKKPAAKKKKSIRR